MNRVKTLPPKFLLITLLLACVAAVPSGGAAMIQGNPGQNVSSTPLKGSDMPAFCNTEQGGSVVHCEPEMQNVSPRTPTLGNFTPGSSEHTSGRITQEFMNDCPSMMEYQYGYTGFDADPLVASGGALSHGFAPERKIAYTKSQAGSTLAGRASIDQSVEPSGQQNLQFAGVSGTALTFSEPSKAKGATSGFAYTGYRGSGARASVGSVSFPHWCRF